MTAASMACSAPRETRAAGAMPGLPAGHQTYRAMFLGVPIHLMTMEQTLSAVVDHMRSRTPLHQVSLNVAKLVNLRRDQELAADVMKADIISADGMGIVLAARLFGVAVPERVAGVDLMDSVLATCAAMGFRPYFLGARAEILSSAMERLAARHPNLRVAGCHHGYFAPSEEDRLVAQIRALQPDCLFVGMPTPRKERFMARHHAALGVPFTMGVGGGIDIMAGHVRRAPVFWQRCGMEWLYRLLQEPGRMWHRYLTTNTMFLGLLVAEAARRSFRPRNCLAKTNAVLSP